MINRILDFFGGLFFAIKYKLGLAVEGVDFVTIDHEGEFEDE